MSGFRAGLLFAIKLINPKIDRVKETNSDMFANVDELTRNWTLNHLIKSQVR